MKTLCVVVAACWCCVHVAGEIVGAFVMPHGKPIMHSLVLCMY